MNVDANKIPEKSGLGLQGSLWLSVLGRSVRPLWQGKRGSRSTGQLVVLTQQSEGKWMLVLGSLFIHSGVPVYGTLPPTFRVGLPTSVKSL